jgi:hypothetical protein
MFSRVKYALYGCLSVNAANAVHKMLLSGISKKFENQEIKLNSQTEQNVSSIVDNNSSAQDEESLLPTNNDNNNDEL